jgi:hypothetical protein
VKTGEVSNMNFHKKNMRIPFGPQKAATTVFSTQPFLQGDSERGHNFSPNNNFYVVKSQPDHSTFTHSLFYSYHS